MPFVAAAMGSLKLKTDPLPPSLVTSRVPRCASAIALATETPMPVPRTRCPLALAAIKLGEDQVDFRLLNSRADIGHMKKYKTIFSLGRDRDGCNATFREADFKGLGLSYRKFLPAPV